jgi:hypothetical protein
MSDLAFWRSHALGALVCVAKVVKDVWAFSPNPCFHTAQIESFVHKNETLESAVILHSMLD